MLHFQEVSLKFNETYLVLYNDRRDWHQGIMIEIYFNTVRSTLFINV